MVNVEIFEAFFLQADVDCDGVISGPEAVNFFKATNVPQPTLAKIWKFVDEGQKGFLSRQEFYNALKLVTIAQTGKEFSPEVMKATLIGTNALQIPPPQLTPIQQFPNIKKEGFSQAPFDLKTSNFGYKEHVRASPSFETPWPKMFPHDVQRYVHVFNQIDSDEDGKISGDETRNLFLSWQLPRDVLKNAWTLSDQDGDNMLSKREFCIMVYLLEKFTEGFPLPSKLPMDLHLDKSLALDSLLANKEDTYSINPPSHIHSINKDKEFKEANMPTLTSLIKPSVQGIDLNKDMVSQTNKAEYYHSKLQEIGIFKSQCDNKCTKMIEKIIEYKNEVNFLRWQCDLKSKFASKVETLMTIEDVVLNENQMPFDLLAVELHELKKMLVDKGKLLGLDIKQELPKKILLEQINSNNEALLFSKTLIEEPNMKTPTIINEKTLVNNWKVSKSLLEVDTGSIMMNETIKTKESVIGSSNIISNVESNAIGQSKVIQDDNTNFEPQTLWSVQENSQSIQILSESKKLKSRGSFEPEDYFDFTKLHDLEIQQPSNEGSTIAFDDHIRTNHQETCPNYLQLQK